MGDHYIPRYYLKGFEMPSKPNTLWAFRNGKSPFMVTTTNIAQENNFYTSELEQYLATEIEQPTDETILKIRTQQKITKEEKFLLAKYMGVMLKRVPQQKLWTHNKTPEVLVTVVERIRIQLYELRDLYPQKSSLVDRHLLVFLANEKVNGWPSKKSTLGVEYKNSDH